ncbi:hypothetical protein XI00_04860 [Bradyrhizobium sp. CCBAU 21359]|nr:hypothetical protein [Bradyrhizobium sp. CCBAU 21359]
MSGLTAKVYEASAIAAGAGVAGKQTSSALARTRDSFKPILASLLDDVGAFAAFAAGSLLVNMARGWVALIRHRAWLAFSEWSARI